MLHIIRAIFLVVVLAVTVSFAFNPAVYALHDGQQDSALDSHITYVTMFNLLPVLACVGVI